jgi:carbon monoxide dehydrogenase subunit G
MKVAGQAVLHAPIDQVWAALNDPTVLARTIPGCERLEATGPNSYALTVTAGVAAIKGTYAGSVTLTDQVPPSAFVMRATGSGAPGIVSASVAVTLDESDGSTLVTYDADATVGGVIGGIGQRMLAGVAKKLAGDFFAQVDDVLTGASVAAAPAVTDPGEATGQRDTTARQVFTASGTNSHGGGYARPVTEGRFALGALVGAAIALLGVLVGHRVTRRQTPRS